MYIYIYMHRIERVIANAKQLPVEQKLHIEVNILVPIALYEDMHLLFVFKERSRRCYCRFDVSFDYDFRPCDWWWRMHNFARFSQLFLMHLNFCKCSTQACIFFYVLFSKMR